MTKNFKEPPKSFQDPVLWAWLEFFSPLRDTNSNKSPVFFFLAQHSKRYCKLAAIVDFLRLFKHPKRYQIAINLLPYFFGSTL